MYLQNQKMIVSGAQTLSDRRSCLQTEGRRRKISTVIYLPPPIRPARVDAIRRDSPTTWRFLASSIPSTNPQGTLVILMIASFSLCHGFSPSMHVLYLAHHGPSLVRRRRACRISGTTAQTGDDGLRGTGRTGYWTIVTDDGWVKVGILRRRV
jgi:hypothetical protein